MAAPLTSIAGAVLICLTASAIACARSELPEPEPVLPASYRPLAGTAPPLWVEPGYSWVGNIDVDPDTGDLSPSDCEPAGFAHSFVVRGFFLDADEVRGVDYLACVSAGACTTANVEPDRAATLRPSQLEEYCRFRGGRLPLASELARASAGDDFGLTTEAFYRTWLACDDAYFEGAECESLADRVPLLFEHERTEPLPIRADARDIGPFGHWDLYGSQLELTATFDTDEAPWCSYPDWFLEPPTTKPSDLGDDARLGHAPAWSLATRARLRKELPKTLGYWVFVNAEQAGLHGGRCAYDPEYKIGEEKDE